MRQCRHQVYLCFKASYVRQSFECDHLNDLIRNDLPELKKACENSPYFRGFRTLGPWFRESEYDTDRYDTKFEADFAIKEASKLSWLDKCFIW